MQTECYFLGLETGHVKLSFHSGHDDNVFQAKIMPYTDDRCIVTCAADGQVDMFECPISVKERRGYSLSQMNASRFYVLKWIQSISIHFDLRTGAATQLFTCQSLISHGYMRNVQLNAIAIDPKNPNLFTIAGYDGYTGLYDIPKYKWDGSTDFGQPTDYFCPPHLIGDSEGVITGLAFSDQSELLVSYCNEFIYLFTRDMGLGPDPASASASASSVSMGSDAGKMGSEHLSTACPLDMDVGVKVGPQVYKGHRNRKTVKGVNFFGPKCEYVVSGSDCGRIFIWKKKGGELIRVMEADKYVVNCIESHPHTTVLVSSGIKNDIKKWTPLPPIIEKVYHVRYVSLYGQMYK
ncbi:hypothetical protein U1Q18_022702 [Sarracenia purpurea var. burkii]